MPKSIKSPFVVVKKSLVHGKGLFAKKKIKKGTKVIEYVGRKVKRQRWENDDNRAPVYTFELNRWYHIVAIFQVLLNYHK